MKKTIPVTFLMAVVFCLSPAFAESYTGKQIAQMVKDANQSDNGVVSRGTITLQNLRGGKPESRKMILVSVTKNDLRRVIFRFTDSSYKGTTFLTLERPGSSDNLQYLYLNSIGSPRQIESSDKEKKFVDTDMTYEDLGGGKISDFTYKRLDDKKYSGRDCYVIERYPDLKKRRNSQYSKHWVMIDKETLVPVAVKSYSRAGRLVKTLKTKNLKTIRKGLYYPEIMTVTDVQEKHQTITTVKYAKETKIHASRFRKQSMNGAWVEQY